MQRNLKDRDDPVDDVKLVGEVDDVVVEGAGDDREHHVRHREHGGEAQQFHVLQKNAFEFFHADFVVETRKVLNKLFPM